jgi:hypothetical protein
MDNSLSTTWNKSRPFSLVPSPQSSRWSDWHWSAGGRIVRVNLDNIQEEEECGDRLVLEQNREILKEVRQEYLDSALKAKSKSRAKELMRGVRDKERQIAWVERKLSELGSDSGGDRHLSSRRNADSQEFLEDKSDDGEISSRKNADSQEFLEDKFQSDGEISSLDQRRHKGDGSGCIYYRTVTKKGKQYREAYYQYEFWEKGDRLVKSCKYIPKGKLAEIQRLNKEKAPVREILQRLGVVKV